MDILRCLDMFLITKILDLAYVQNYSRCLSQNKSDTKLFKVYLFTVFTIKRPRALASLAPLGLLIVKAVTNILLTITCKRVNKYFMCDYSVEFAISRFDHIKVYRVLYEH